MRLIKLTMPLHFVTVVIYQTHYDIYIYIYATQTAKGHDLIMLGQTTKLNGSIGDRGANPKEHTHKPEPHPNHTLGENVAPT